MYIQILLSNESEPQEMVLCRALHFHSRCSARLKQLTTDEQHIRGSTRSLEPQSVMGRPGDTISGSKHSIPFRARDRFIMVYFFFKAARYSKKMCLYNEWSYPGRWRHISTCVSLWTRSTFEIENRDWDGVRTRLRVKSVLSGFLSAKV